MSHEWDLLVVGGGTAGIVSAKTAAGFGARVLLVERERTGGDCLWTGCVPSKSLIAASSAAAEARRAHRLGVDVADVHVDFGRVMQHVRDVIAAIEPADSPRALEDAGAQVKQGDLTFTGPHSARVGGRTVTFAQAVVCTGSSPALPPIPGLAEADPLTSDTVWGLDRLPGRLLVLGGGNIGCELGQAFARLGSEVTIVESEDRILPREDREAAEVVAGALAHDGVRLRTGVAVTEVKAGDAGGVLVLDGGEHLEYDRLLVAVGRRPGTADLGLGAAGVELDERGYVRVDDHLRTTNPDIWAAGDVTGLAQLTHTAGVNGSLAAANAVLGVRRTVDTTTVPRVTFTRPEVAAVGVGTGDAGSRPGLHVVTLRHDHLDRALAEGDVAGFTRLVLDGKGRLLGATIVGPRAGETLGEVTLAVKHGMRAQDLAGTSHAYPTYNDAVWNAAIEDVRSRLRTGSTGRAVRTLASTRRRWVGSSLRRGLGSR